MREKNILAKITVLAAISMIVIVASFGSFYTYWNSASPENTCASCHEITNSVHSFSQSSHQELSCNKCHGTALSNGWHSFSEKAQMVLSHFKSKPHHDNIRLSEMQLIETMSRCKECHQAEYASWKASGHSATYADIFLDETHNATEQLNFDCLRCHGMFYEGTVLDLVEPISVVGPWQLKDQSKMSHPTILCMTCHQIHSPGSSTTSPDYSKPNNIFYGRHIENNTVGFYYRYEKMHFLLDKLPLPVMLNETDTLKAPADPIYKLCVQCHAPSVWHQAGNDDDRTPKGVHEGLSCNACHERHSNYQRKACNKCHPAISNCNLDVKTMNTTYFSPSSEHDIHSVACIDCHKEDYHLIDKIGLSKF